MATRIMLILRDQYLKTVGQESCDRTQRWLGFIETWGEFNQEVRIFDYSIKPFDQSRDIHDIKTPQRLLVDVNIALTEAEKSWNPSPFIEEICSILTLVTGRLMRAAEYFGVEHNGEILIRGEAGRNHRAHRDITVPVQNKHLQTEIDRLAQNLINIHSEDEINKHVAIMRSLKLYNDSICLVPVDVDAAYVLLVAAAEVLGSEFSSVNPNFDDFSGSEKIVDLVNEYGLDEVFLERLREIIFKPKHIKLRAKFVDVIKSNLRSDFFENLDKTYVPIGKVNPENYYKPIIMGWKASAVQGFGEKQLLEKYLKNIYDKRSSFVHAGVEFPFLSKMAHEIISGIKTDKRGNPVKNSDGTYAYKNPLPPYFWFERVINNVIQNVIESFGSKQ